MSTESPSAGLQVRGPDGVTAKLRVHMKRALEPRGVLELCAREKERFAPLSSVVVAPYLSSAVRERLVEGRLGFIDLTGSVRLALGHSAGD